MTNPLPSLPSDRQSAKWLRSRAAAAYLCLAEGTLAKLRWNGQGPRYQKLGRAVVYEREALDDYARASRIRGSSSSSGGGAIDPPLRTLPDAELVAQRVHEVWVAQKAQAGIGSRIMAETGEELVAPWEQLSEKAKDLDRMTVLAVYLAIDEADRHG